MLEEDDDGRYTTDKTTAIRLASMAWTSSKIDRNIKAGFKACGTFSLSLVNMSNRLGVDNKNGVPSHVHLATCLHVKSTVKHEVLRLPLRPKRSTKRNRVELGGQWLTQAKLEEAAASATKAPKSKPGKPISEPAMSANIVCSVVV
ncbi:hypothetical protein GN958_ATG17712 [Phytophthora infestans]|uniref:Uncharacterized protein n=1 Tax=Phytophthora infestans TaxID=4787 RepID=A0A8S9TWI4_PHYIN|nr:hypothetical protein GN958_ATG17712 [Phytophthora infestans]